MLSKKMEDYCFAQMKAAQNTTAETNVMVRMMGCSMAARLAEMSAVSLAEAMDDLMVRLMACLLVLSLVTWPC